MRSKKRPTAVPQVAVAPSRPSEGAELARAQALVDVSVVEGAGELIVPRDGSPPYWDPPEYGAKIAGARERTSEGVELALISLAKAGDLSAAWALISVLGEALRLETSSPVFEVAAAFFERLDAIRLQNEKAGHLPTRSALVSALKSLHIVRARGRPRRDDAGSPHAAGWEDIRVLATLLKQGAPILQLAADFFCCLLAIHEAAIGSPATPNQLSRAFQALHILKVRGRAHELADVDVAARLAAEEIERVGVGGDVKRARARLMSGDCKLHDLRQRDIRRANPEIARVVSPGKRERGAGSWLTERELEALAGAVTQSNPPKVK